MEKLLEELSAIKDLLNRQAAYYKPFLSVAECASFLDLSEHQVYKLIGARKLRYSRPGGKKIYFERAECERFALSNVVRSADEIGLEAQAINRKKGERW
ncbi:helix-turn-helix domain-containing protein [Rufibacter quisquiliarum]|uniref:Excisionase family DNA binding protein n=1 Tax=Rufibacter quisquiliarum TaxID=1549639 RepID=A0A839GC02_9BACT|nr:helix-turn-helix domain-containing protein [Rufibacter quisquiliarum]MBA9077114.1 excisionase family DNA binding protein [Rufibacter quisquiliarum]